ncbi:MAG: glutamate-5-semialdehyde dehydrogenase, partial [Oscillospiraceae bacterium]
LVALDDPIGYCEKTTSAANGLTIKKVRVPLGVVAIIFESRPNVTSDAAALCLKSGNAVILRGGKEAINSNTAIAKVMKTAAKNKGFDENIIGFVTDTSRDSATALMQAKGYVDLLIPRGGAGLINACKNGATVPCIQTGTGICHVYVDEFADLAMAIKILENAKMSRPSVCNAAEVCLVQKDVADKFLPMLAQMAQKNNLELRLCEKSIKIIDGKMANEKDFDTEFLDYILAVKIVENVSEAISHINAHSTGHSESIITNNDENANKFLQQIDSAAVYHNASTRFTDGGVFGLGCEIGIATQKLGARGPMGLFEVTSYKYIVLGDGQIR